MVTLQEIAKALNLDPTKVKQDFSTYGEVKSVNPDNTYQVSLNGSDTTVKCARLTGAKVGDVVLVTVLKNGYAVVTGCVGGDTDAADAMTTASEAATVAGNVSQHFWFDGSGAHVTEDTQEDYEDDPANAGGNTLITSEGMSIRKGTAELAKFAASGSVIGPVNYPHIKFTPTDLEFYGYVQEKLARLSSAPYPGLYLCSDVSGTPIDASRFTEYSVRILPVVEGIIQGQVEIMAPVNDGDDILRAESGATSGYNQLIDIYYDEPNQKANMDITGDIWSGGNIEADGDMNCNGNMSTAGDIDADGSLILGNSTMVDFITTKGKSGNWYYEKYKSGKIEAWGTATTGTLTMSGSNRVYVAQNVSITNAIPSGIFNSTPSFCEVSTTYSSAACYSVSGNATSNRNVSLQIVKTSNNTAAVTVQLHCIYYPSTY